MLYFFEKNKALTLLLIFSLASFIFFMSSLSHPPASGSGEYFSIGFHFFAFFILAFLLLAFVKQGKMKPAHLILSFTLAFVYAISDELHQLLVPNRVADIFDIAVDTIGISCSLIIYSLLSFKR